MIKKIPNYIKILIGMVVGLLLGIIAVQLNFSSFIKDWVAPFGDIFMRLLKMIAIPLVLVSLVRGIGGLKEISKLASLGLKTLLLYTVTTIFAVTIGVMLVMALKPGDVVSAEASAKLTANYTDDIAVHLNKATHEESSPLQGFVDMFPENAFQAFGNNGAMLQVIILALLIGMAAVIIGEEKNAPFMSLMESLELIILKIIDIIMWFAPYGVAALLANMIVESAGDTSLIAALGLYALTVILGLFILMYAFYPTLIALFSKVKLKTFFRAILPVQLMGFSTSSSAATLSTTMNATDNVLHLPKTITSFTLPVGVTINMDGTSLYQAVAAIFIAQVMGIDLAFSEILIIIGTTTLSSIGTPGVPGGSVVILMMVLGAVGIPPEGLALILGVDRPLDMLRTAVNVTGDVTVSSILSKNN